MAGRTGAGRTGAAPISPEERDRLFKPLEGRRLALCVSGGADSMALLHLVADWAGAAGSVHAKAWREQLSADEARVMHEAKPVPPTAPALRDAGEDVPWLLGLDSRAALLARDGPPPIIVLTVDHGLRPEAAEEANFVSRKAAELGLAQHILRGAGPKPETGIQEWARGLRHRLLLQAVASENARLGGLGFMAAAWASRILVMAHHLGDQAETVLMRLGRGSGLAGLGGMRSRQTLRLKTETMPPATLSAEIRRPFLSIDKCRLVATLEERNADWVEDPSNNDERFERVRVRKAMEELERLGISSEMVALSARRLRAAQDFMDGEQLAFDTRRISWNDGLFGEVSIKTLMGRKYRHPAVALLGRMLRVYGGEASPATLAQAEGLLRLLGSTSTVVPVGAGLTLGGCKVDVSGREDDRRLRIYRELGRVGLAEILLRPGQSIDWDGGRFRVTASAEAPWPVAVGALGTEGWSSLKRAVPGLVRLQLPAEPMATLPAFRRNREIVDVPFLANMLKAGDGRGDDDVRLAWRSAMPASGEYFSARFAKPPSE